jgi:hypothetical protein
LVNKQKKKKVINKFKKKRGKNDYKYKRRKTQPDTHTTLGRPVAVEPSQNKH